MHRHKDVIIACTNIRLNKWDFIKNRCRFLFLENMALPYCKPGIQFIGPIYIEYISVDSTEEKMMHIYNMVIYILMAQKTFHTAQHITMI